MWVCDSGAAINVTHGFGRLRSDEAFEGRRPTGVQRVDLRVGGIERCFTRVSRPQGQSWEAAGDSQSSSSPSRPMLSSDLRPAAREA